jgi:hypothetical protein
MTAKTAETAESLTAKREKVRKALEIAQAPATYDPASIGPLQASYARLTDALTDARRIPGTNLKTWDASDGRHVEPIGTAALPDPELAEARIAQVPATGAVAAEIDLIEHVQKGNVHIATVETRRAGRPGRLGFGRKPRVHFGVKGSSVLGALVLRGNEPHRAYRAFLPAVWALLAAGRRPDAGGPDPVLDNRKARWSRKAGCSCPCSPGFILEGAGFAAKGLTIWVTLEVG